MENSVPVNRGPLSTSFSSNEKKKFGDTYPTESPEVQAQIRSQCVFCNIHGRKLFETERVYVIKDIHPDAEHHYLIIPKDHVLGVDHLTKADMPLRKQVVNFNNVLVQEMEQVGREYFSKVVPDLTPTLGFHAAPFNSVEHLHLHCLAGKKSFVGDLSFAKRAFWFKTIETVLEKLIKQS